MTEVILDIKNSVLLEVKEHWVGFAAIISATVLFVVEPYVLASIDLGAYDYVKEVPYLFSTGVITVLLLGLFAILYLRGMKAGYRDMIPIVMFIATAYLGFLSRLGIHPTFLTVLLILSIIFLRATRSGRISVVWTPMYLVLPLLPISLAISTLGPYAKGLYASIGSYVTSFILPFVLIANLVRSEEELERWLKIFFLFSILSVIVGMAQFVIFETTGTLTTFTEEEFQFRDTFLGALPRATAFMTHPNIFGAVSAILGVMMSYYYIHPEYLTEKERRICLYGSIFCYIGVLLSGSRGDMAGVALIFGIVVLKRRNRYLVHYCAALGILLVVAYATGLLDFVYEQYLEMKATGTVRFRVQLNAIAIDAARNYPIHGIGDGGFNSYNNPLDHVVHNFWLYILAELGVIGLFAHLFFLLCLFLRLVQKIRKNRGKNRMILESFLFGMIIFFFLSLMEPLLANKFYWFYFGLAEAAILVVGRSDRNYRFLPLT